jgi:hypothetical protein
MNITEIQTQITLRMEGIAVELTNVGKLKKAIAAIIDKDEENIETLDCLDFAEIHLSCVEDSLKSAVLSLKEAASDVFDSLR